MANSGEWRKVLNRHPIFDVLRRNREKQPSPKDSQDIIALRDGDLYVWNAYNANILTTNLRNLLQKDDKLTYQALTCTYPPVYDVDQLVFNATCSHVALLGARGVSVLQLPQRWGKYAEFEGGKEKVLCKTISIAERFFTSSKVRLLHAAWHPGSKSDSQLVLLTSDNCLRIYALADPQQVQQTFPLSDGNSFRLAATQSTFSAALGEVPVGFDFGLGVELKVRPRPGLQRGPKEEAELAWPIFILYGNGDIYTLVTSLHAKRPFKSKVIGPLSMHPAAEDNYGTDACSLLCVHSQPQVLVVATSGGSLHHCVVLNQSDDDSDVESVSEQSEADNTNLYQAPAETSLYVYESVELELSLTTISIETDDIIEDDFSCPIRLHRDPVKTDRYHCSHSAGVHSVMLPWLPNVSKFCREDGDVTEDVVLGEQATVEHLVCTKPLASSPPSPILGLSVTGDRLLGSTLLALTSTLECIALPLLSSYRTEPPPLVSSSPGRPPSSPLKRLHREQFDQHIKSILQRNTSNPFIKTANKTDLSPQECFQLLSRTTQVFRVEYVQKQDHAREEIERRLRILREQKEQQMSELRQCQQVRNILTDNAGNLAEKYEEAADNQQRLVERIETVLRQVQARLPSLSYEEMQMQKDLKKINENLQQLKNQLEEVKTKHKYQQRSLSQPSDGGRPPSLSGSQMSRMRSALKEEGDEIAGLVKQVGQLKLQIDS